LNVVNHISRLSATDAVRDFSRLLDRVGSGAEFNSERPGEPVAVFAPSNTARRRLSECRAVSIRRSSSAPDPDFARDLDYIIAGNTAA
jgi:antitoxin (DNA-binding transcriptional repressor) of toxin-antitoxin stability system